MILKNVLKNENENEDNKFVSFTEPQRALSTPGFTSGTRLSFPLEGEPDEGGSNTNNNNKQTHLSSATIELGGATSQATEASKLEKSLPKVTESPQESKKSDTSPKEFHKTTTAFTVNL